MNQSCIIHKNTCTHWSLKRIGFWSDSTLDMENVGFDFSNAIRFKVLLDDENEQSLWVFGRWTRWRCSTDVGFLDPTQTHICLSSRFNFRRIFLSFHSISHPYLLSNLSLHWWNRFGVVVSLKVYWSVKWMNYKLWG